MRPRASAGSSATGAASASRRMASSSETVTVRPSWSSPADAAVPAGGAASAGTPVGGSKTGPAGAEVGADAGAAAGAGAAERVGGTVIPEKPELPDEAPTLPKLGTLSISPELATGGTTGRGSAG